MYAVRQIASLPSSPADTPMVSYPHTGEMNLLAAALDQVDKDANPRTSPVLACGLREKSHKVVEEMARAALETVRKRSGATVRESADPRCHLVVLWHECGIKLDQVWAEMRERSGQIGIGEKLPKTLAALRSVSEQTRPDPRSSTYRYSKEVFMPDTNLPGHHAALDSAHIGDIQGTLGTIRQADRRAPRSPCMLPAYVWVRPATIAVFWSHRNNGSPQVIGGHRRMLGRMDPVRSGPSALGAIPTHSPAKTRARAVARSSRAAMAYSPARSALQAFQRRAGMAAYFAGAQLVLAATHHLNRGRLLSQGGPGAALGAATP